MRNTYTFDAKTITFIFAFGSHAELYLKLKYVSGTSKKPQRYKDAIYYYVQKNVFIAFKDKDL